MAELQDYMLSAGEWEQFKPHTSVSANIVPWKKRAEIRSYQTDANRLDMARKNYDPGALLLDPRIPNVGGRILINIPPERQAEFGGNQYAFVDPPTTEWSDITADYGDISAQTAGGTAGYMAGFAAGLPLAPATFGIAPFVTGALAGAVGSKLGDFAYDAAMGATSGVEDRPSRFTAGELGVDAADMSIEAVASLGIDALTQSNPITRTIAAPFRKVRDTWRGYRRGRPPDHERGPGRVGTTGSRGESLEATRDLANPIEDQVNVTTERLQAALDWSTGKKTEPDEQEWIELREMFPEESDDKLFAIWESGMQRRLGALDELFPATELRGSGADVVRQARGEAPIPSKADEIRASGKITAEDVKGPLEQQILGMEAPRITPPDQGSQTQLGSPRKYTQGFFSRVPAGFGETQKKFQKFNAELEEIHQQMGQMLTRPPEDNIKAQNFLDSLRFDYADPVYDFARQHGGGLGADDLIYNPYSDAGKRTGIFGSEPDFIHSEQMIGETIGADKVAADMIRKDEDIARDFLRYKGVNRQDLNEQDIAEILQQDTEKWKELINTQPGSESALEYQELVKRFGSYDDIADKLGLGRLTDEMLAKPFTYGLDIRQQRLVNIADNKYNAAKQTFSADNMVFQTPNLERLGSQFIQEVSRMPFTRSREFEQAQAVIESLLRDIGKKPNTTADDLIDRHAVLNDMLYKVEQEEFGKRTEAWKRLNKVREALWEDLKISADATDARDTTSGRPPSPVSPPPGPGTQLPGGPAAPVIDLDNLDHYVNMERARGSFGDEPQSPIFTPAADEPVTDIADIPAPAETPRQKRIRELNEKFDAERAAREAEGRTVARHGQTAPSHLRGTPIDEDAIRRGAEQMLDDDAALRQQAGIPRNIAPDDAVENLRSLEGAETRRVMPDGVSRDAHKLMTADNSMVRIYDTIGRTPGAFDDFYAATILTQELRKAMGVNDPDSFDANRIAELFEEFKYLDSQEQIAGQAAREQLGRSLDVKDSLTIHPTTGWSLINEEDLDDGIIRIMGRLGPNSYHDVKVPAYFKSSLWDEIKRELTQLANRPGMTTDKLWDEMKEIRDFHKGQSANYDNALDDVFQTLRDYAFGRFSAARAINDKGSATMDPILKTNNDAIRAVDDAFPDIVRPKADDVRWTQGMAPLPAGEPIPMQQEVAAEVLKNRLDAGGYGPNMRNFLPSTLTDVIDDVAKGGTLADETIDEINNILDEISSKGVAKFLRLEKLFEVTDQLDESAAANSPIKELVKDIYDKVIDDPRTGDVYQKATYVRSQWRQNNNIAHGSPEDVQSDKIFEALDDVTEGIADIEAFQGLDVFQKLTKDIAEILEPTAARFRVSPPPKSARAQKLTIPGAKAPAAPGSPGSSSARKYNPAAVLGRISGMDNELKKMPKTAVEPVQDLVNKMVYTLGQNTDESREAMAEFVNLNTQDRIEAYTIRQELKEFLDNMRLKEGGIGGWRVDYVWNGRADSIPVSSYINDDGLWEKTKDGIKEVIENKEMYNVNGVRHDLEQNVLKGAAWKPGELATAQDELADMKTKLERTGVPDPNFADKQREIRNIMSPFQEIQKVFNRMQELFFERITIPDPVIDGATKQINIGAKGTKARELRDFANTPRGNRIVDDFLLFQDDTMHQLRGGGPKPRSLGAAAANQNQFGTGGLDEGLGPYSGMKPSEALQDANDFYEQMMKRDIRPVVDAVNKKGTDQAIIEFITEGTHSSAERLRDIRRNLPSEQWNIVRSKIWERMWTRPKQEAKAYERTAFTPKAIIDPLTLYDNYKNMSVQARDILFDKSAADVNNPQIVNIQRDTMDKWMDWVDRHRDAFALQQPSMMGSFTLELMMLSPILTPALILLDPLIMALAVPGAVALHYIPWAAMKFFYLNDNFIKSGIDMAIPMPKGGPTDEWMRQALDQTKKWIAKNTGKSFGSRAMSSAVQEWLRTFQWMLDKSAEIGQQEQQGEPATVGVR